jgi:hypothetical protein
MPNFPIHLARRAYASRCLDLMKLRDFVPCDVSDATTGYTGRIAEAVFDPLRVTEVNDRFRADGFSWDDNDDDGGGVRVIAATDDGSILAWGGLNSVHYLRRGELLVGAFQNLAFQDVGDLVQPFGIKNTKAEIDALIEQLKKKYTKAV